MSAFNKTYDFFGVPLVCNVLRTSGTFALETDIYKFINKRTRNDALFKRVETTLQDGFPDIALFRGVEFLLIECKLLRKKRLVSVQDDLTFEYGQLPFMFNAVELKLNYALTVAKGNELAFIRAKDNRALVARFLKGDYKNER